MENLKEIMLNDTVYVRKYAINEDTKRTGLYREVIFCGIIWQVIAEDAEKLTLLAKKCLDKRIIKEVFSEGEYDSDYDVKFNLNSSDWRWENSIIRKRLNDRFLKMLDKDSLVPMTTTVWLDGESSTTKDYVRLLTVEEIFKLPKFIKENKSRYGSWSLSPYYMYANGPAYVFDVGSSGYLADYGVTYTGAVAPVINLKRSALSTAE